MKTVTVNKSLDHGWAWIVLAGCTTIFFLVVGIDKCMGLIYLELLERLQENASTTAWIIATATAGRLLIAPFTSALCKKYGCRIVTMTGGTVASAGLLLGAFPLNLPFEYFAIGIGYGLGSGLYFPAALIMTVNYFDKRLGMAASLSASGGGLGIMIFPFLFNVLMNTFGFTGTLFILSAINLHIVVVGALFRPPIVVTFERGSETWENYTLLNAEVCNDTQFKQRDIGDATGVNGGPETGNQVLPVILVENAQTLDEERDSLNADGTVKVIKRSVPLDSNEQGINHGAQDSSGDEPRDMQIKECQTQSVTDNRDRERKRCHGCCKKKPSFLPNVSLLKYPGYLLYLSQTMLVGFAQLSFMTFFAALAEERGASHSDAALLLTISGVVDIPAKLTTGFIVDLKRIRPHRRHVLTATIFVNSIVIAVTPLTSVFSELAAVGLALGLVQGVYVSQLLVVLVDIVGRERQGDALGLSMFSRSVSMLCGPSVIGYIKDVTQSYNPSFYMCGAAGVLAGLLFLMQFFFFPIPSLEGDTTIIPVEPKEDTRLNVQSELAVSTLSLA